MPGNQPRRNGWRNRLGLLSQMLLLGLNVILFIAYWDDLEKFHFAAMLSSVG
jgi:hypothetical protein